MKTTLLLTLPLIALLGVLLFKLEAVQRREGQLNERIRLLQKELAKRPLPRTTRSLGTIRFTPGSPAMAVKASVNGAPAGRFLIDTGATYVTLSRAFADRVRIPYQLGVEKSFSTQGGTVRGWVLVVDSIVVNGVKAKKVAVAVLEVGPSHVQVDGLLGLSFLSRFKYQIDSGRGEIVLQTAR